MSRVPGVPRIGGSAPLLALAAVLALLAGCSPPAPPADDTDVLASRIEAFLAAERFDQVRSVIVDVAGDRRYVRGDTRSRGNVYSVTKSVMATLIGIADGEGRIGGVDRTLGELLPTYAPAAPAPLRAATLQQVLTMTAGIPTDDAADRPGRDEDWAAHALTVGPQAAPGSGFAYSTTSSHLLSAVLTQATGSSALEYGRRTLFGPLGVATDPASGLRWEADPQGRSVGGTGLVLSADEMLALGRLHLARGSWNGTQLVPAPWVAEATRTHVPTGGRLTGYGYQWWTTTADGHPAFTASGFGGQLVEIVPDLDLVVVVRSDVGAAPGAPPDDYAEMVDTVIAPALGSP